MTTTTYGIDSGWAAKLAEANDGVGAARDALARARTHQARRQAHEDLDWWIGRRAYLSAAIRAER